MTILSKSFFDFDPGRVPSPCFVVDEIAIENNLKKLQFVQEQSGAKILLALKAFSMFSLAPLISRYLKGCCASGFHEARLAYEEYYGNKKGKEKREVHVFSPAYKEAEIHQLCEIADHMVFNSFSQWEKYKSTLAAAKASPRCGLRINPMLSLGETAMYDPCSPTSRLGITAGIFHQKIKSVKDLQGISGLHFHTLCEQGFGPLAQTLDEVEKQFAPYLKNMQWLNFGGGHHLSRGDYEVEALVERIGKIQRKYQLQVYLEPGEAVALGSGVLVSEVLDFVFNQEKLAILDTSASCHMPDTLEMPYRAELFLPKARGAIKGKPILVGEEFSQVQVEGNNIIAGQWGEHSHNYVLGGQTCLAGDVIGQYSFPHSLNIGQRVMFDDMAHYTMVKTTTFNGVGLPALAIWNSKTDKLRMIKEFSYEDFARRLS